MHVKIVSIPTTRHADPTVGYMPATAPTRRLTIQSPTHDAWRYLDGLPYQQAANAQVSLLFFRQARPMCDNI
jgi:hypothetical protein